MAKPEGGRPVDKLRTFNGCHHLYSVVPEENDLLVDRWGIKIQKIVYMAYRRRRVPVSASVPKTLIAQPVRRAHGEGQEALCVKHRQSADAVRPGRRARRASDGASKFAVFVPKAGAAR